MSVRLIFAQFKYLPALSKALKDNILKCIFLVYLNLFYGWKYFPHLNEHKCAIKIFLTYYFTLLISYYYIHPHFLFFVKRMQNLLALDLFHIYIYLIIRRLENV